MLGASRCDNWLNASFGMREKRSLEMNADGMCPTGDRHALNQLRESCHCL